MAIDPVVLDRMRRELEALELGVRRRRVTQEAAELGLVRVCSTPDCGRTIAKYNQSGLCKACKNRLWMARHRAGLRVVREEDAA